MNNLEQGDSRAHCDSFIRAKELVDKWRGCNINYQDYVIKRYNPSYTLLKQAIVLTPKNANTALSLVKVHRLKLQQIYALELSILNIRKV